MPTMKTLTVRLPDQLVADIEAESRARKVTKSDVVRDRLGSSAKKQPPSLESIRHIIGSVDGLPADLSANVKRYLKSTGYGRNRSR